MAEAKETKVNTNNGHEEANENGSGNGYASGGGCPFMNQQKHKPKFPEWQTETSKDVDSFSYREYLHLDEILNSQKLMSEKYGVMVHDEHLFIIVHQTYELWFKQIIFEIDSIMTIFSKPIVDDRCLLVIVSRLQRINQIWKLLNEQITILESMAPTDFLDFRGYLTTSSGFQSLQFRVVENKLGLLEQYRIKFNQNKYDYIFVNDDEKATIKKSVDEPSILKLIEAWLERTPGLTIQIEIDGSKTESNHFKEDYEKAVVRYLKDTYLDPADVETDDTEKQSLLDEYRKNVEAFQTIFDREKHNKLMERGERKISHKALWGALMIWLNRDEPRFHLPYQMISLLTDLDAQINRWRYNHALLVQREVGNKSGTGGSSGYSYLRSTASDRYKVFYDIVNLSTWLIPRQYVPKLSDDMKKCLATYQS